MTIFDWGVLALFFGYTLWDGIRAGRQGDDLQHQLLAGRRQPWWLIGVSVMASQASAITFIGATGQSFMHDMRFLQVYLGLPIAMIILCVTLVPFFHRLKVFTAYEALEQRFGLGVRLTTSAFFLISRGASVGITIAAPAYVLALILDWPLNTTICLIGGFTTLYTLLGGITAVMKTDLKQMILMLFGLAFCFGFIIYRLPEGLSYGEALHLAGDLGKLEILDFNWDLGQKYNLWSGLIAGLFMMLSYFGADQSMVQRYLTARSLGDARASLIMSAVFKVPMQFLILLLGVNLYVFYLFEERPLLFIPDEQEEVSFAERKFQEAHEARQTAAWQALANPNAENKASLRQYDQEIQQLRKAEIKRQGESRNDTNYVFPYFMLHELPAGILGLLIAAIMAAALSSIDSMLNSLAASSVVDWYRRLRSVPRSDKHDLYATYGFTAFWGAFATLTALFLGETESIIEVVNQLGSYFYGPLLGIFCLLWIRGANGRSAMIGLLASLALVFLIGSWHIHCDTGEGRFLFPLGSLPDGFHAWIEYLWLNPIGLGAVCLFGWIFGDRGTKKN
ncbi:MAG: sodium:solute symporter [Bacteroidota bacterium]